METFILLMGILTAGIIDAVWRQKNIDSDKITEYLNSVTEEGRAY